MTGVPASPSGHEASPSAAEGASSRSRVPNAAASFASKSFTVYGMPVTRRQIADAIDRLANLPAEFVAMDLVSSVLPGATFHQKQEALNRLFQRWRKLGLVRFKWGRWRLVRGAWETLQASAIEARSDATPKSDAAEGESAARQGDAP